jgi:acetyl-CoA C-acetyltransferase
MSRVGIGMSGGAWFMDPSVAFPAYFMPQGVSADLIATKYGFSRDDVDAYAVQSQKRAAKAWEKGYFKNSVIPVKDQNGLTILAKTSTCARRPTCSRWPRSSPSFVRCPARWAASMRSAIQAHPEIEASTTSIMPAIRPASSMARPPCCSARRRAARSMGLKPRARIKRLRQYRLRAGADADRSGRRHREAA